MMMEGRGVHSPYRFALGKWSLGTLSDDPYISPTTATEKKALGAHVARWDRVVPLLQQVRDADIRR